MSRCEARVLTVIHFIEQAVDKGAVAIVGEQAGLSKRATTIVVPNSREALAQLAATYFGDPVPQAENDWSNGHERQEHDDFLV